jgi:hypothetical protein
MRPQGLVEACRLKHGALNGHVGEYASNLDTVQELTNTQRGLWDPASNVFRGRQFTDELAALALREDDIAGHCLAFDLSAAAKPAVSPAPRRRASACMTIAARCRIVSIRSIVPSRKYIGSIRFSTGRRVEGSR